MKRKIRASRFTLHAINSWCNVKKLWSRLSGPMKIGVGFALAGGLMAGIGWLVNPQFAARTLISFVLAVGISSVVWGVVAWAIATAAFDVEHDVENSEQPSLNSEPSTVKGQQSDP